MNCFSEHVFTNAHTRCYIGGFTIGILSTLAADLRGWWWWWWSVGTYTAEC